MIRIKYDINLMKFISLFETLTRAKVKDCIEGDPLIFVVKKGEIGKAIGKKGANIRKVENLIKRKIKIIEFDEDIIVFVSNIIAPVKAEEITKKDNIIVIKDSDPKTKGKIIGRDSQNRKFCRKIVSRYFDIDDIIVR